MPMRLGPEAGHILAPSFFHLHQSYLTFFLSGSHMPTSAALGAKLAASLPC